MTSNASNFKRYGLIKWFKPVVYHVITDPIVVLPLNNNNNKSIEDLMFKYQELIYLNGVYNEYNSILRFYLNPI